MTRPMHEIITSMPCAAVKEPPAKRSPPYTASVATPPLPLKMPLPMFVQRKQVAAQVGVSGTPQPQLPGAVVRIAWAAIDAVRRSIAIAVTLRTPNLHAPGTILVGSSGQPSTQSAVPSPSASAKPSSIEKSQLLSWPSQTSVLPGKFAALLSSQSSPRVTCGPRRRCTPAQRCWGCRGHRHHHRDRRCW